jgi:hypothetical protein
LKLSDGPSVIAMLTVPVLPVVLPPPVLDAVELPLLPPPPHAVSKLTKPIIPALINTWIIFFCCMMFPSLLDVEFAARCGERCIRINVIDV